MNRYSTLAVAEYKEKNKVLKNTYSLLSASILFSAFCAYINMTVLPFAMNGLIFIIGHFMLLGLITKFRNSAIGIGLVFVWTGLLGFSLGPLLNSVMVLPNGGSIVTFALTTTGVIFLSLSSHVVITKKDYSYLNGILLVAVLLVFMMSIGALVFSFPALHLLTSGLFILISSGYILYQTSLIINGGERNYILATVTLYVSIYNIFISLLRIYSAFSGRR